MKEMPHQEWRAMSRSAKASFARKLVKGLPNGASFLTLAEYSAHGRTNEIAEFEIDEACFHLIPGGEFQIGFDPGTWEPTVDEQESWEGTAEEYDLDPSPVLHLRRVMNPVRQITFPSMLVESGTREFGWERLDLNDARVRGILREDANASIMTSHHGDEVIRVCRMDDGSVVADQQVGGTHDDVIQLLAKNGFRLPSSDEWEFLCGAGVTTLFRWGDHVPCDRYPTDINPEEAAWRRQWVLSAGTLKRPTHGFLSDWDRHRVPNAFGLTIAANPYQTELVAEPDMLRGGDGGCTICGGAGFFAGWLPLATAYFEEDFCNRDVSDPIDPQFMFVRRVLPLC